MMTTTTETDELSDKGLPSDREAEQVVLGALLTSEEEAPAGVKDNLFLMLHEADFWDPPHQEIFGAAVAAHEAGQPVELPSIAGRLQDRSEFDNVGGETYLSILINGDWGWGGVQKYAERVRDLGLARRAVKVSEDLGKLWDHPEKLIASLESSQAELRDISARRQVTLRPARRTSWTADELLAADFPPLRWIVPDILPEGLSILGGRPKLGKSILALQIAQAVATGGKCLGRDVEQGEVLMICLEDPGRRIKERMVAQGWPPGAVVVIELDWPLYGAGGLEKLYTTFTEHPRRLTVMDTVSRFTGTRIDQDRVGEMTAVLGEFQAFVQGTGNGFLLLDHHNKATLENPVDALLGSTAKGAVPDCILGLYKRPGVATHLLRVVGRDLDSIDLPITFDRELLCWQPAADAHGVAQGTIQEDILSVLEDLGGKSYAAELADALERDRGNIYRELQELLRKGAVIRGPKAGRNVPYLLPGVQEQLDSSM